MFKGKGEKGAREEGGRSRGGDEGKGEEDREKETERGAPRGVGGLRASLGNGSHRSSLRG